VRALICGAGIAGLTLARLLSQQGWSVHLAERAGALRHEGYMIDFFGPGFDAAEAMGLLPRLRELSYSVSQVS
jgi:2-polyprenyl-6-methoxyphenol hydroxylase-like FAD-dependent oxidoreductase